MPSRWLALEANFEMWFAQEISWLIVVPKNLNDFFLCMATWLLGCDHFVGARLCPDTSTLVLILPT